MDPRTRLLLEAPIARTLLKLGAPNVLVMFMQLTSNGALGAASHPALRGRWALGGAMTATPWCSTRW